MIEETETLVVPRGGTFTAVAARIALRVAEGWQVGEVRFELYKPAPAVRVPPVIGSRLPRAKRSRP